MDDYINDPYKPYTEVTDFRLINIPMRVVECLHCHYQIETDLPAPKCGICHSNLIRIIPSHFGPDNELVK